MDNSDMSTETESSEKTDPETDGKDEYELIMPLVKVEFDKTNNFDEIFRLLLNSENQLDYTTLTQHDLHKLDNFGIALA